MCSLDFIDKRRHAVQTNRTVIAFATYLGLNNMIARPATIKMGERKATPKPNKKLPAMMRAIVSVSKSRG